MQNTTNFNLKKPEYTDPVDIADINDNMDIIDSALKAGAYTAGTNIEITSENVINATAEPIPNLTLTELTLGNYKIVFNELQNSLDFEVI